MNNTLKELNIKCQAHFQNDINSSGMPTIVMFVDELINDEMFILTNTGRWFHHGGKQLSSINNFIEVSGSRFTYEGEVHPGSGYSPELDFDKDEASFSLLVNIINTKTNDDVWVNLRFVASTIDKNEVIAYRQYLDAYNAKLFDDNKKANDIMDFLKEKITKIERGNML